MITYLVLTAGTASGFAAACLGISLLFDKKVVTK